LAGVIVADTLQDGAGNSTAMDNAIYGSAKAWVNFNPSSGSSASIVGSYNVSSVTYTSTGSYIVNYTNALANTNYSVFTACIATAANAPRHTQYNTLSTSSVVIYCCDTAGGVANPTSVSVAIHI